jgi:hypothetical protein
MSASHTALCAVPEGPGVRSRAFTFFAHTRLGIFSPMQLPGEVEQGDRSRSIKKMDHQFHSQTLANESGARSRSSPNSGGFSSPFTMDDLNDLHASAERSERTRVQDSSMWEEVVGRAALLSYMAAACSAARGDQRGRRHYLNE